MEKLSNPVTKHLSVKYLESILDYNPTTGVVFWKNRPRTDFITTRRATQWKNQHEGKEAGKRDPNTNKLKVSLHARTFALDLLIYKLVTQEDPPRKIYHRSGWNVDNHWKNLTTDPKLALPATTYEGGPIKCLTAEDCYYILDADEQHCFGVHESFQAASINLQKTSSTLECDIIKCLP